MVALYSAHDAKEDILTTEMNSLADGANKMSAAFSNDASGERDLMASFILELATTSTRTGTNVDLYILPEVDTVYASGSDSVDPEPKYKVDSFTFDLATTAKNDIVRDVRLPNSNFKVLVQNNLGILFAATGTTLKMERYNYEDV